MPPQPPSIQTLLSLVASRQSSGRRSEIYVLIGLAVLIWLAAVGITCWMGRQRRIARQAMEQNRDGEQRENGELEIEDIAHGLPTRPERVRREPGRRGSEVGLAGAGDRRGRETRGRAAGRSGLCGICQEETEDGLPCPAGCGAVLHAVCLGRWLGKMGVAECPVCRGGFGTGGRREAGYAERCSAGGAV